MIANTILPERAVSPTGRLKVFWTSGTIMTNPKNPNTTEGIPARSSIKGFRIERICLEANSAIYIATDIPKGRAKSIAPILTHRVPNKRGINPNCAAGCAVGYHSFPPKKSTGDIFSLAICFPLKSFGR